MDMAADGLPPLRDVIRRHRLDARRALGQNFLLDLNLTGRIARAAGDLGECDVLEIGPGPGGLTRGLLVNGARRVVAIERDKRCLPALAQIAAHYRGRLEIISGDALKDDLLPYLRPPVKIIANLPYNIATPLLIGWLQSEPWPPWYISISCMFQREVAQRIVAGPGSKTYGRLSVMAGWRTQAKILFDIAPAAFTPPPKVISSIVQLTPRREVLPCTSAALEKITAAAFGQRRKMLRSSLKSIFTHPESILKNAGIDPTMRAEQLEIADFCKLAKLL